LFTLGILAGIAAALFFLIGGNGHAIAIINSS